MYELGLSRIILPEFDRMMQTPQNNKHHIFSVGEHTIQTLMNVRADKILRLTMLFHDVAKPVCRSTDEEGQEHYYKHPAVGAQMTKDILKRLKFDNDTIKRTCKLIEAHDDRPQISPRNIRRAINRIGIEQFPDIFEVKRADILGQSEYKKKEKLAYVDEYERTYEEIISQNQCIQKKDLQINGKDLIAMGMKPGKQMGEVIDQLFESVLENPELNDREKLIELAHKKMTSFI